MLGHSFFEFTVIGTIRFFLEKNSYDQMVLPYQKNFFAASFSECSGKQARIIYRILFASSSNNARLFPILKITSKNFDSIKFSSQAFLLHLNPKKHSGTFKEHTLFQLTHFDRKPYSLAQFHNLAVPCLASTAQALAKGNFSLTLRKGGLFAKKLDFSKIPILVFLAVQFSQKSLANKEMQPNTLSQYLG